MSSLTWANRSRYKGRERRRQLKSWSEMALGRDYGDLNLSCPHVAPQRRTGT